MSRPLGHPLPTQPLRTHRTDDGLNAWSALQKIILDYSQALRLFPLPALAGFGPLLCHGVLQVFLHGCYVGPVLFGIKERVGRAEGFHLRDLLQQPVVRGVYTQIDVGRQRSSPP